MAGAADLHHVDFGCILALLAAIFTVGCGRAAAGRSRALLLIVLVRHCDLSPSH